jgi:uncharacterized membrane protein YbjE (DUF340 family)
MQSIWLILQLLFCLALGFIFARRIPSGLQMLCFKVLPYFGYILLIAIAMEFFQALNHITHLSHILTPALTLSATTSIGAFLCCYLIFKALGYQSSSGKVDLSLLMTSLINISYALLALIVGIFLAYLAAHLDLELHVNSWWLLLLFMFLIGLDLAYTPINRSWLNWKILLVPLGCILGSLFGAYLSYLLLDSLSLTDALLFSQGYGFYSMSGIVISELKGAELGSIALINDLFREIFAILLMYCIGWRYPRAAISSAGATAMDVTLPMVKQACGNDFIPHAMVSGFILSVIAPIAVSLLAVL